ncbi:MAG: M3 family metallopeptidase [Rothia sp. (in: high G+C Gram-positive bacteria)]|uniref:M3 family metallopeptidase n=1 Tax=Rothia sp. (in: high G+C Gram-positive bacteria) TaxID=1885016 RepID=UPI002704D1FF|nr:M3 family metallopeptidase [Rothia sp. (in: high G+C Gram-positive bacteria)]
MTKNPLLTESTLPFHLPDFAAIRPEHYLPALEIGLTEARSTYTEIAELTEEPTFDNVVALLERPSATLERTVKVFYNLVSADGTPELLALEATSTEKLTQLENDLYLNPAIFSRLDAVYRGRHEARLTYEQIRLTEKLHQRFTLAGAALNDSDRETLASLNLAIAQAQTAYSQQVTRDLNAAAVLITDEAELAGMPASNKDAARAAARAAGHEDGWLLTFELYTQQPALAYLSDRAVRQRIYTASVERGSGTWSKAAEIAALRAQKAALLGFDSFAALAVADRTAGTPEAVEKLFAQTIGPAMRNADREAHAIAALAAEDGIDTLEPWDMTYYSEKVKARKYAVDLEALQPYFELNRVLENGVFYAAHRVYGLSFEERTDLAGYHEQVRVWEVFDADGSPLGLFLGDFFTRDTKRGGAWMNTFVDQSRAEGTRPVVVNNLNIPAPAEGQPAFVTFDEVKTLFHEFGHALHGLLSDTEFRSLSGTNVERDIVEYPSQVNEMWMLHPEILPHYAVHYQTGEPVPAHLIEAVLAAETWGQGQATVEYLRAAALDWAWHKLPAQRDATPVEDPRAFERQALTELGLWHELVESRYRTSYLNHTFSGGYAAGYYSYLWAEVFDADTVAWYEANGGLTRENGDAFRHHILAIGGTRPIPESFKAMTGRTADTAPLLKRRGLI